MINVTINKNNNNDEGNENNNEINVINNKLMKAKCKCRTILKH